VDEAEVVLQTLRAIWTEWSDGAREFDGSETAMQRALAAELERRLGRGWEVLRERGLRDLPRRCTAWRRYDVMVLAEGRLMALLELSLGDTNVAHALHNGELKLLGRCDARGVRTHTTYAEARDLTADDVRAVRERLAGIPVRGLLFVAPPGSDPLDEPGEAVWHETKGKGFVGETHFRSALFSAGERGDPFRVTLRDTFEALAAVGLWCWYYAPDTGTRLELASRS